ncbi:hypothetical protein FDP41_013468 [Naegleria fowleri]|uniref:DUF1445 domain-containing protein n=1 Tax=Naegleria fowleri TaxID=5763 RepID=A0A6A5C0Z5_NAEFO|nr:uncharacterized protein FDP41_013468 [Naegleria fowleri]KAF0980254.1 hypothetical protein FDP41_013468 [Naegleria fowleri]
MQKSFVEKTVSSFTPNEFRKLIRSGEFRSITSGYCEGYIQANLVILPQKFADEFEQFCKLNHAPCPVLEKLQPGEIKPKLLIHEENECDIRKDIPKYRVYKNGVFVEETSDVSNYWRDDLVTFLIGCSFSFERALQQNGIEVRNITEKKNVSMYNTNMICKTSSEFKYLNRKPIPMVVSMRPIPKDKVDLAVKITEQFTTTHGGPVHCGDPNEIGISDLNRVDYGESVTIHEGEIPCFWACGVTSSIAALSIQEADLCITHAPGNMFISDLKEPTIVPMVLQCHYC